MGEVVLKRAGWGGRGGEEGGRGGGGGGFGSRSPTPHGTQLQGGQVTRQRYQHESLIDCMEEQLGGWLLHQSIRRRLYVWVC